MACPDFNEFTKFILAIDQHVAIEKDKDKPLRYNVWQTTQEHVADITGSGKNPDVPIVPRIKRKLDAAQNRIRQSSKSDSAFTKTTQKDIFENKFNREMSIALQELMESVKGESDKARNLSIEVSSISDTGVLPALPLSRVAASIGRKIAFQKGYRFKRATNADTSAQIEAMYYDLGREAISQLEQKGYAKVSDDISTIMDYQSKDDLRKDFPKNDPTRSDVLAVSISEKKLGIGANSPEADYFLNRTEADLTDTDLGMLTEKLRLVAQITQPQTIVLPDVKQRLTDTELAQWDDGIKKPDEKTAAARKAIYEKPMFVNKALHSFLQLMNEESLNTGKSATKRINEIFGTRKNMINSLFGLKRSDDFSIDKKESIAGQNLSKTTPLDDLVEYYDQLQVNGAPAPLHMPMKIGRNGRLYYLNSVLNPHASKQSRYMLTPGEYTVVTGSAEFDYLVHKVASSLKSKRPDGTIIEFSYQDILNSPDLTAALGHYDKFQAGNTVVKKMQALGPLIKQFQGVDYVTLLTGLQAVKDIRNPKGNRVSTEFTVSADATASGGTLTFMQALGTNDKVLEFLQRIGLLHSKDTLVKQDLDDLYGLMSNSITDFMAGEGAGLGSDIGGVDVENIMKETLNLLFDEQKDIRELSKDPTMVFVYGQGKASATTTIARSLADRIIDNLDDPKTREYLSVLFQDKTYTNLEGAKLKAEKGLYKDIVEQLKSSELPQQMYDLMKENIKDQYLDKYTDRSQQVYDFLKKLPTDVAFKVLPAGAVLDGKKANNPDHLKLYGMPLTKIVEVLNEFDGKPDTVLTRQEKLIKTVMDVSTTHGQDAALLYHSLDDVNPDSGTAVIHDDVRGNVKTVRAMEAAYAQTAKKMVMEYDVHQQIMEAIAAQSGEIAASSEFKTLKASIDANVAEKKRLMSALFNENSDALIGDGTKFETFAQPSVDTAAADTVQSAIPTEQGPSPDQDFGDKTLSITGEDETVEFLAQEYWDSIQSRLDMVKKLKACLI